MTFFLLELYFIFMYCRLKFIVIFVIMLILLYGNNKINEKKESKPLLIKKKLN